MAHGELVGAQTNQLFAERFLRISAGGEPTIQNLMTNSARDLVELVFSCRMWERQTYSVDPQKCLSKRMTFDLFGITPAWGYSALVKRVRALHITLNLFPGRFDFIQAQ